MTQAEGRLFTRRLITEPNTSILTDAELDTYLDGGQEALNDILAYHLTDDSTNLTFTSGTQDYTLPADCVTVLWVEWSGNFMKEADEQHFRRNYTEWRTATAGSPADYFVFGRSISFYPKPNVNTPKPTIRYVSTPVAYSSTAFAQLCTQHHRIPCYHAAAEWLSAHGFDANFARAAKMTELFEKRAAGAAKHYGVRKVGK